MLVAFAIAALTRSASSFDINLPAFAIAAAGRGSSVVRAVFVVLVDTVVDKVSANAVSRLSGVRNDCFPRDLS